jgi:hypothetical protein
METSGATNASDIESTPPAEVDLSCVDVFDGIHAIIHRWAVSASDPDLTLDRVMRIAVLAYLVTLEVRPCFLIPVAKSGVIPSLAALRTYNLKFWKPVELGGKRWMAYDLEGKRNEHLALPAAMGNLYPEASGPGKISWVATSGEVTIHLWSEKLPASTDKTCMPRLTTRLGVLRKALAPLLMRVHVCVE